MGRRAVIFAWLAATSGIGAAAWLAPGELVRPLRAAVRDALRPGQMLAVSAWDAGARSLRWAIPAREEASRDALAGQLRRERLRSRRLLLRVARMEEQVREASALAQPLVPGESPAALLVPRLVEARLLGEETASLWRTRRLLSTGTASGIDETALVLESGDPLLDAGSDAGLSPGDAVYAGRVVLGKIAEVGRYSSTFRLVTDPRYSGRARVARRTSQGLVFGPEGTLTGDGSPLCRLNHVAEPVNVGDEVYTGGTDGILPYPMYYGTIVSAEPEAGSREWSIRVRPAAAEAPTESVHVLRMAMNPDRLSAE